MDSTNLDCYDGTFVLINKLDIRSQEELDNVEQTITAINAAEIEELQEFVNVDFNYYKNLHYRIFGDLYEWAGKVREINISKKATYFCRYDDIEPLAEKCFARLKKMNFFADLPFDKFIEELTELYCTLNFYHPFREGNGRVQRLFLTLLIRNAGYDINFADIDADELMVATIKSVTGDIFALKDILYNNIKSANL